MNKMLKFFVPCLILIFFGWFANAQATDAGSLDVVFPSHPLFNEGDFKPGFITTRCFQVTNNTDAGVPVGIVLDNYIDPANLGGALDVIISQASTTGNIFTGTMAALYAASVPPADGIILTSSLLPHTPVSYCVNVTFQTAGGNVLQGKTLSFDFNVGIASGGGESTCGNGQQEAGEQCDLGEANGLCPSACSSACTLNDCGGDGVQGADLAVVKTVDKTSINAGDSITYNVAVHNLGPDIAHNVVVTDVVPASINIISATPAQGSYSTTTGQWIIGTLDVGSGSSTVLTITGTVGSVTPSQVVVNSASVKADETDTNLSNNTSSATSAVPGGEGCVSNCGGGGGGGGGSYSGGTTSGSGATISGQKFNDLNLNGLKDTGDVGLPGWIIYLDSNGNKLLDTGEPYAITDAQGNYSFSNVIPGTVHVREVGQSNWAQTFPGSAQNFEHVVIVTSGNTYTNMDFGNSLARVGGAFTNVPNTPQVLGATTGLPKTGIPPVAWLYLVLASLAGGMFLARRREE